MAWSHYAIGRVSSQRPRKLPHETYGYEDLFILSSFRPGLRRGDNRPESMRPYQSIAYFARAPRPPVTPVKTGAGRRINPCFPRAFAGSATRSPKGGPAPKTATCRQAVRADTPPRGLDRRSAGNVQAPAGRALALNGRDCRIGRAIFDSRRACRPC